ncbi:MAG: biotin carboxyl carrier protein, partial [Sciscionella sp.]
TLARQLGEIGRPELFDAVIEESVQVREDLGWPIVMTPFAQYIVTQATLNVIAGERYQQISDEVVDLLRGDFGALPGPVNQNLLDRALSTQRGRQPADDGSADVSIGQLRDTFGHDLSDEDLMLRAVMPAEQVDAMVAARTGSPVTTIKGLLRQLEQRDGITSLSVSKGDSTFSLTRGEAGTR